MTAAVQPSIAAGIPLACSEGNEQEGKEERPEHLKFSHEGHDSEARVTDDGRLDIDFGADEADVAGFLESIQPLAETQHEKHRDLPFPVKMNIVIHVVGSRGDVQPFIVLGQALQKHGHRVRLATHLVFRDFVKEHGLEFFNIGGDPAELMSFMVKNPKLIPKMETVLHGAIGRRRREMRHIIAGCWRSCFEAGEGLDAVCEAPFDAAPFVADAIIANPPSFAHIHCAEKLAVPLHLMFTMPWSPTTAFPHPLANIHTNSTKPSVAKITSYAITEMLIWQGLGDLQNQFRRFELGLEPLDSMRAPSLIHRLRVPFTYFWSPSLLPKPDDWQSHIDITGFHFLASHKDYTPPTDLLTFLDAGEPPIYIGFGSIVVDDPEALTQTILDAVRLTGQRALISQGWGGLGAENNLDHPDVFFIQGNVPHDWLFTRVSCVVHHGGAGTTAIGLALGRPTTIVPFFGDQPFWGALVAVNEAGPWPIPFAKLTADRLADAIHVCLDPETVKKAGELSERIRSEDGASKAVKSFHRQLNLRHVQCSLCPDRPAVWRVRRSKILLSPLAASVLVRGGHVDPHDLKLYRSKRYDTNTDPRGPFCAGVEGIAGAMGNFVSGLVDVPMNVVKGFAQPAQERFVHDYDLPTCSERAAAIASANGRASQEEEAAGMEANGDVNDNMNGGNGDAPRNMSGTTEATTDTTLTRVSSGGTSTTVSTTESTDGPTMASSKRGMNAMAANTSYTGRRLFNWILEIPMGITLLVSQGFHDAPRWYNDRTVRDTPVVTGVRTGLTGAGRELGYSCYDGITGVVTQPRRGWKEGGASGMAKGVGKGIGGILLKPQAGLWGLLGYPLNGVFRSIEKSYGTSREEYIVASRIRQGDADLAAASEEDKATIITRWKILQEHRRVRKARNEEE